MAQPYIDITGTTSYREATGDGTFANPYIPQFSVTHSFAPTSTLTNVAGSATSVTLLAANNNRKTVLIVNDSTSGLYIAWSSNAASTSNYSIFLRGKIEDNLASTSFSGEDYSGQITGIWATANGFARITEVV